MICLICVGYQEFDLVKEIWRVEWILNQLLKNF